ncbi:ATP-dependent 6-phosphofructokinase [Acidobacteria bacterium ACD]|nr:ATP-dependent 6-phosphofructokinase [Acidobacteria bacterium ACD]
MTKYVGVLTAGGDSPGLNAALRGIGKAAIACHGMQVIGFRDGFRGLMENRTIDLDERALSGILTVGGTILGTSRDKPYSMPVAGKPQDMTDLIVDNYHRHHLDVLVCLGGGGTQKNAFHLMKRGLNVVTLPKTIDNDVAMTDVTFGFDTALGIATEAIDRLHSTAHSHHRIIVVEVMGHRAGWLALGAGVAGGADVILLPEIPYDVGKVAEHILRRSRGDKRFSIVAVAEGALSVDQAAARAEREREKEARRTAEAEAREAPAGRAGRRARGGKAGAKNTRLLLKSSAPCSPFFTTRYLGPISMMAWAAFTRLCSSLSWRASESLIVRMSTRETTSRSFSRELSIQKFMVSITTRAGDSTWSSTLAWITGSKLPSIRYSVPR